VIGRRIIDTLGRFGLSLLAVAVCLLLSVAALSWLKFGREAGDSFATGVSKIVAVVWERSLLPGNNSRNWFESLLAATPILLTGLCVAVAFRANVLNIGGEGQYVAGAVAATVVGLASPARGATISLLTAAALAGAIFAALAAVLEGWRRVPMVLSTLLLNFIAFFGLKALLQGPLHERSESLQSEQWPEFARLPRVWFHDVRTRLHVGFFIALGCAVVVSILLRYTVYGFRLRATGENPTAARFAGIPTGRVTFLTMALSGALAGLAGGIQISGIPPYQLLPDTGSSGFGFTGIAVALLGRLSPAGVVLSAIFFGWLQTAFARLQIELGVPFLAGQAAQGMILITMLILAQLQRRSFLRG
jgi:simple sugar transport system permease protein